LERFGVACWTLSHAPVTPFPQGRTSLASHIQEVDVDSDDAGQHLSSSSDRSSFELELKQVRAHERAARRSRRAASHRARKEVASALDSDELQTEGSDPSEFDSDNSLSSIKLAATAWIQAKSYTP
jgi:hypothetical protein